MRSSLLVALVAAVVLMGAPAPVQSFGRISIYSDAAFTQCTLSDTSPGVVNVYVAEWSPYGATGLRFRLAASSGFTGVWLSETSPYFTLGSTQIDFSVGFGLCMVGTFHVVTVAYQMLGTSVCSELSIVATPGFSEPICTGCVFSEEPCYGYDPLHVNCSGPFNCNPVAIEPTTWGRVKALYRD